MGFWSNVSKVFGARTDSERHTPGRLASEPAPQPTARIASMQLQGTAQRRPASVGVATAPPGWTREGGTPIHATPHDLRAAALASQHARARQAAAANSQPIHPNPAGHRIDPITPRNAEGELVNPPRTKQELFEELHRNYREVLHLVRKVNTHLDREQARGDRMMRLAAQVEAALPQLQALTQMPGAINEHASRLHAELVAAMHDVDQSDEQRARRMEIALGKISETMHEGAEGQANLTRTMASFRETISDANKDARRSSQAMEELATRSARREEQLMKLLADSKRWSAVGLAMCGVVGLIAVGVGILAVLLVTGHL